MLSCRFLWSCALLIVLAGGCATSDPRPAPAGESENTSAPLDLPPTTGAENTSIWPTPLGDGHQRWTVEVIGSIEHDPGAFTQGLEIVDEGILEGTGRRGSSTLRLLDDDTGEILRSVTLDESYFGEGITEVDDEILQLTWQSGVALRYDAASFTPLGTFAYDGEGWGLCFDGTDLWMSNGSARLTRRDPETFAALGEIAVRRDGEPITRLNELECAEGRVLANVWQTDEIVVIDPTTGVVDATIDAAALAEDVAVNRVAVGDPAAVLNGIAAVGDGTLLLGGKLWPRHFVVEVVAETSAGDGG